MVGVNKGVPVSGHIFFQSSYEIFHLALLLAVFCMLQGCASQHVTEQPAVIHEDAHSGGSLVAFNLSGDLMVSGGWEGGVKLWRMSDGALHKSWRAHDGSVNGAVFSADGERIITAGYDGTLAEWTIDGVLVRRITTPEHVMHMMADYRQDRLLTGHADGSVRLWEARSLALLETRQLHQGAVKAVAINPAARRYASSSTDGTVVTWDEGGPDRPLEEPPADAWTLAFSPDGQSLYGGTWFKLLRWDIANRSLTVLSTEHHGIIKSLQFINQGRELATISRQTDSSIYFLDPLTGAVNSRYRKHDLCGAAIAVSPQNRFMATTSDDASVRIWNLGQADNLVK